MESLQLHYQTLLPEKDLEPYQHIKNKLAHSQAIASNLLQISCNLTILNDDIGLQNETSQSKTTILKDLFKVLNVYKAELDPDLKLESSFDKNANLPVTNEHIDLFYGRAPEGVSLVDRTEGSLHQVLNVFEEHFLYKQNKEGKCCIMVTEKKLDTELVRLLFELQDSSSTKQTNQAVINIATQVINNFQKNFVETVSEYFEIKFENNLSNLNIKGNPITTLLVSKLYIDYERVNCVQKKVIVLTKTMKSPNRMIVFYKDNLLYTNHEYLNNNLKKMIADKIYPKFQTVIQQMEYSEKQQTQILNKYRSIGYHQSSSKKWNLLVDREWIEFTFQIQPARRLGIINKQQKGYLDLFTTSGQQLNNQNGNKKAFKTSILGSTIPDDSKFTMQINYRPIEGIKHINQFQFNILDYDVEAAGILSYQIIVSRFPSIDMDKPKLQQFIRKVGYLYQMNKNTFHNIYHMFTVLHGAFIISKCDKFNQLFDAQTAFTYLIGALCHDVAHTGVTNFFEEKVQSRLANRFGDKSILQANSIAQSLKLLSNQSTNFLINFPEKTWRTFRKLFVSGILATDNKNHLAVLTDFESATKQKAPLDVDSTHKLIGGLLHTADFWGNIKNFKVSYEWSKRVNQQFSKQYEREASMGIQLTPYFKDLNNIKVIAKNQQIFTSAIVSPLYRRVNEWTEGYVSLAIERITSNTQKWKEVETGAQEIQFFLQ